PCAARERQNASLIRQAGGPFWLGSISKLTRSPPASESKFALESSPVRWKKYSRPSSAAMNPNPRSETSFLMVPVGISNSSSRKLYKNERALSRRIDDRGVHRPLSGDENTLPRPHRRSRAQIAGRMPSSNRQEGNTHQDGAGAGDLERCGPPLPQPPDAPNRNGHDGAFANGRHDRERRDAQGEEDQQVAAPHEKG